jgi:hypothetical protein
LRKEKVYFRLSSQRLNGKGIPMNNVERNELLQLAGSVASGFVAATGVAQDEQGIAKFSLSVARELIAQVDYIPPVVIKETKPLPVSTPGAVVPVKRGRKPKA